MNEYWSMSDIYSNYLSGWHFYVNPISLLAVTRTAENDGLRCGCCPFVSCGSQLVLMASRLGWNKWWGKDAQHSSRLPTEMQSEGNLSSGLSGCAFLSIWNKNENKYTPKENRFSSDGNSNDKTSNACLCSARPLLLRHPIIRSNSNSNSNSININVCDAAVTDAVVCILRFVLRHDHVCRILMILWKCISSRLVEHIQYALECDYKIILNKTQNK